MSNTLKPLRALGASLLLVLLTAVGCTNIGYRASDEKFSRDLADYVAENFFGDRFPRELKAAVDGHRASAWAKREKRLNDGVFVDPDCVYYSYLWQSGGKPSRLEEQYALASESFRWQDGTERSASEEPDSIHDLTRPGLYRVRSLRDNFYKRWSEPPFADQLPTASIQTRYTKVRALSRDHHKARDNQFAGAEFASLAYNGYGDDSADCDIRFFDQAAFLARLTELVPVVAAVHFRAVDDLHGGRKGFFPGFDNDLLRIYFPDTDAFLEVKVKARDYFGTSWDYCEVAMLFYQPGPIAQTSAHSPLARWKALQTAPGNEKRATEMVELAAHEQKIQAVMDDNRAEQWAAQEKWRRENPPPESRVRPQDRHDG